MTNPSRIRRKMRAEAAFQAIARQCVDRYRRQLPGLRQNWDVEAVHQARVGLRQLVAAFALFKPMIRDAAFPALRDRVKDVTRILGQARNLDVLLEAARQPDLPAVRGKVSVMREHSYADLVGKLENEKNRTLAEDLLDWVEHGAWRTRRKDLRHESLRGFAGRRLDRIWRKFRERSRHVETLAARPRHKVRIAAKKLRYELEFIAPLAKGGKARARRDRMVATLRRMQDALGSLNDLRTQGQMAPDLARGSRSIAFAAGRLLGAGETRAKPLLRQAAKAQRKLRKQKPFWN